MIFVTVGTNEATFDRLLGGIRDMPDGEELIVQHGPSAVRPPGARCLEFLPFDELVGIVRRARVVVTHAGVGSIVVCLANGHRPIVVPRLHRHGEAVDDHQLPLCHRLAEAGLVTVVEEVDRLPAAVAGHGGPREGSGPKASRLAGHLRGYLEGVVRGGA
ncbi:MAG: glycosyltransferase [Thermoleophilia bacterium]